MRIILVGYGKMGRLIEETALAAGDSVVGIFDETTIASLPESDLQADVVIDFSRPEGLDAVAAYVRRTGTALVSGTTGYTPEQKDRLASLGDYAPVLWSANYSLGVAVLAKALALVAGVLRPDFDVELTEIHHNQKVDAPSGTAKLLVQALDSRQELTPVYGREGNCGKRTPNEIGIHALRGGTVAGTHTVHFFGPDEELEFTHRAASRRIFVNGALTAARKMVGRSNGLVTMDSLLFNA